MAKFDKFVADYWWIIAICFFLTLAMFAAYRFNAGGFRDQINDAFDISERKEPPGQKESPSSGRASEKPKITLAKYNQLKDSMSYKHVVGILGFEGTEISSNNIAGIKTIMYKWDAGFMANMNVMFQNDKLISKSQFGLK